MLLLQVLSIDLDGFLVEQPEVHGVYSLDVVDEFQLMLKQLDVDVVASLKAKGKLPLEDLKVPSLLAILPLTP